jgi:TolA-binding protein
MKRRNISQIFPSSVGWVLMLMILSKGTICFGISEEKEYEAAWQLCQAGKYSEANEAYKKYLSRHPKGKFIPEARFTLARIEMSGNNAFGHYQFIVDNYPAHPLASQASYATAQYLQNVGSTTQARERYLFTYSHYGSTPAGRESLSKLAILALSADSVATA